VGAKIQGKRYSSGPKGTQSVLGALKNKENSRI
jgi:hypothetical protein